MGDTLNFDMSFDSSDMLARHMGEIVAASAKRYGKRKAFSCILPTGHSATINYLELDDYSDAVAAYLREELGLKPGDVVAVQSPNILSYPILSFGIMKAGLTVTNVNPLYTAEETNHQLKDSGAKVWFVIDVFGNRIAESINGTRVDKIFKLSLIDLFPPLKKALLGFAMKYIKKVVPPFEGTHGGTIDDVIRLGRKHVESGVDLASYTAHITHNTVAIYQYTGGTTGRSKGAELTHGNVVGNVSQFVKRGGLNVGPEDNLMLVIPLYHVYAMAVGALSSIEKGLHVVLVAVPRPLSSLKNVFDAFNITMIPGVNSLYLGLLEEKWFQENPPKGLRLCTSGAAPLQLTTAKDWKAITGATIYEGYGLTEATCIISVMPQDREPRIGSCGIPLAGTKLRIVGDDGKDLPIGEPGELWLKGPQIMKGYLHNPSATDDTMVDGWLKTGDVAKVDEDGYLYIVDRLKDMILVSGFNVYPADIEDILTQHALVADAAVVGAPDDETGEKVVAFVVAKGGGLSAKDLIAHCKKHLTNYKIPKKIVFLDELPKSPVGKVLRRELRDDAKELTH